MLFSQHSHEGGGLFWAMGGLGARACLFCWMATAVGRLQQLCLLHGVHQQLWRSAFFHMVSGAVQGCVRMTKSAPQTCPVNLHVCVKSWRSSSDDSLDLHINRENHNQQIRFYCTSTSQARVSQKSKLKKNEKFATSCNTLWCLCVLHHKNSQWKVLKNWIRKKFHISISLHHEFIKPAFFYVLIFFINPLQLGVFWVAWIVSVSDAWFLF